MAAAELGRREGVGGSLRRLWRAWLCAYIAIWTATLGIAMLVVIGAARLRTPVNHVLGARLDPQLNAPPQVAHVLALAAHNLPITAWPVLLGVVGAHRRPTTRTIADVVVAAAITANVLIVGSALGAYGAALLPYVPQLPVEWAALALGASSWLVQRRRALTVPEGAICVGLIAFVVLLAAAVETVAVPHR
ncbi:MAG: hypothetical protein ACHQAV_02860 [Solirubrobacterales bacterium]